MKIQKADFYGDPNIGLFGFATDKYMIVPNKNLKTRVLKTQVIESQTARTNLTGIFLAGNSNGLLVPWIVTDREYKNLQEQAKTLDFNICKIDSKHTALGNLIICNDNACIASGLLKEHFKTIERCLDVEVVEGKILDLQIVGSLCIATNKGFLLNMHATEKDFKFVKKNLKVDGDIGTVNFGGPFVRSGVIANSNGSLVGNQTTGVETGRISEALGFL